MSQNRFKGDARTIVGLVVLSLCLGAANCRANVEDAPWRGARGTLLLEAEDFQGVVSRDIWSSNDTWTRAVGAGVDGLADVASGGEMIYAGGSLLRWDPKTRVAVLSAEFSRQALARIRLICHPAGHATAAPPNCPDRIESLGERSEVT